MINYKNLKILKYSKDSKVSLLMTHSLIPRKPSSSHMKRQFMNQNKFVNLKGKILFEVIKTLLKKKLNFLN